MSFFSWSSWKLLRDRFPSPLCRRIRKRYSSSAACMSSNEAALTLHRRLYARRENNGRKNACVQRRAKSSDGCFGWEHLIILGANSLGEFSSLSSPFVNINSYQLTPAGILYPDITVSLVMQRPLPITTGNILRILRRKNREVHDSFIACLLQTWEFP